MKRRFTEEQVIGILKEAEAGLKVKDLCRQHNVTEQTYYRWKWKIRTTSDTDSGKFRTVIPVFFGQHSGKFRTLSEYREVDPKNWTVA